MKKKYCISKSGNDSNSGVKPWCWLTKRLLAVAILLCFLPALATARPKEEVNLHVVFAQVGGGHTGTLTWVLSTDDTTANCAAPSICAQNIYRIAGACPTSFPTGLTPINSVSATATTFVDNAPLFGNSCYATTFVVNSSESVAISAGGVLRPAPQTSLVVSEK